MKDNTILWIGGIIIIGIAIFLFAFSSTPAPAQQAEIGNDFILVKLYDSNMNPITFSGSLSTVNNVPGVSYIDITMTVLNTGNKPLTCFPTTITPSQFDSAMSGLKITKIVPASGTKKASWTSNLIAVGPLEGGVRRFNASISCSYQSGDNTITLPLQSGFLDLNIVADASGSFQVQIDDGGLPAIYCGDGICQVEESTATCPGDCPDINYAIFRTSDLSYVSGSAVALATSCGSNMVQYGYYNTHASNLAGLCPASGNLTGTATPFKMIVPGGFSFYTGTTPARLYADSTTAYICDDDGSKYTVKEYTTASSYKNVVNNTAISFDTSKEVAC